MITKIKKKIKKHFIKNNYKVIAYMEFKSESDFLKWINLISYDENIPEVMQVEKINCIKRKTLIDEN